VKAKLIAEEVGRLSAALAVLECVIVAMEADADMPAASPYYPDVVRAAADKVRESIRILSGP
jgi:hypothetical protein